MLGYSRGYDAPLTDQTIFEAFDHTAHLHPDKLALVVRQQNTRLTYSELAGAAARLAVLAILFTLGLHR